MNVIEISAAQSCARTLNLGIRGENARTEVCFDFSAWAEEFDAPGAVELYVRRYGETTAYPVVLAIDGSEAVWTVSAIDTHNVGLGEAEFVYLIDSTVVKSVVFGTVVQPDIGRPASDPPEPYESWMEELGEMAAGTLINAQRAEAAQTAAETAQGKAEAAQTAAERAQELAETAKSYADADAANAYAYASNAYDYAQSASSAKTAAEYAQGQAEAARDRAEAAQDAAETAQGKAETAQGKAETAQGSAEAAQSAAETAQGRAEAAQSAAEAAQTAAETAQGKAEAAQTAAERAQELAETAKSYADADAANAYAYASNAYDYAQSASSAKTAAEYAQGQAETAQGRAEAAQIAAEAAQEAAEAVLESIPEDYSEMSDDVVALKADVAVIEPRLLASFPQDGVDNETGIATFEDGADGLPVVGCRFRVGIKQLGYGDPSGANVRAFRGWTGARLYKTRKNLIGGDAMVAMFNANVGTSGRWYSEDRYLLAYSGTSASSKIYFRDCFKPDTRYTFILSLYKATANGSNLRIWYTDGTYTAIPALAETGTKETIVVVSNAGKSVSSLGGRNDNSYGTRIYVDESGIFEGELSASDYEAFTGETTQIDWETEAGTVYAGILDVTAGTLTVTHGFHTFDGSESLGNRGSDDKYYVGYKVGNRGTIISNSGACSHGVLVSITAWNTNIGWGSVNSSDYGGAFINFRFSGVGSTKDDYLAYFAAQAQAGTPVQVAWELAEPVVYELDPTEITTFLGLNNLYADVSTAVTLTYRADPTRWDDKRLHAANSLIAGIEPGWTATKDYEEGDLLIAGRKLYKATMVITTDEALAPDSNISETTVAEQLAEIRALLS